MTIIRSDRSIDDIFEIWSYIAERNEAAADALIDRIDAKLGLLSDNPSLGPERPGYIDGLRSITIGKYILFYRPIEHGIELMRVLHGARDIVDELRR